MSTSTPYMDYVKPDSGDLTWDHVWNRNYDLIDEDVFGASALIGSAVWDPANVTTGNMTSTTVTVTGAAIGDVAVPGLSVAVPAGALLTASVTAADTVTVTLYNLTGGDLDLASGALTVFVFAHV